jgi:arginine/lysine/ornithine decarboxylase
VGRDSHKSVFDAISLAGCDAVLLPCHFADDFGISLSVVKERIYEAINIYGKNVRY